MTYRTARADFETLESIAELEIQQALDERRLDLMENPTKAFAATLYQSAIEMWFQEHGVTEQTKKIARRHGITL